MTAMTIKGNYFNGEFHFPKSGATYSKTCPADISQKLWETQADISHASACVDSAEKGFHKWKNTSLEDRISFLRKFQEKVSAKLEKIAETLALEVGKPLWEARTEANAVKAKVDVTINESLARIQNKTIKDIMPSIDGHVVFKPLGPCFVIGPFNFPCHLANGQILSALIAGNSIIFKPSEKTIVSGQLLIECFHEAGFPEGVINLITGGAEVAQEVLKAKSVKGVFFTGSKNVGLQIKKSTVDDLSKLVALELGGKNSSIIHSDATLEHGLSELIKACFLTSGQRCTSTGTILIHQSLKDEFTEKFAELTKRLIIDHPTIFEKDPFMGPLIDEQAGKLFDEYVEKATGQGAEFILPHQRLDKKFEGHYFSPSIQLLNSYDAKKHSFVQDEIFAPHCTIIPYEDLDEAIHIANSTEYGLAASIFTERPEVYQKCLRELDVGIFNLNRSTVGASSKLPFGGVKSSGNYRPAAVSMIDSCVYQVASLETLDRSSKLKDLPGIS